MAIKEKSSIQWATNISIDVVKNFEADLHYPSSEGNTVSGWYETRLEDNSVYQFCVRPDNGRAMDYLMGLGYEVGSQLIFDRNRLRFLLPTNAYRPLNRINAGSQFGDDPFINSVENLLRTL